MSVRRKDLPRYITNTNTPSAHSTPSAHQTALARVLTIGHLHRLRHAAIDAIDAQSRGSITDTSKALVATLVPSTHNTAILNSKTFAFGNLGSSSRKTAAVMRKRVLRYLDAVHNTRLLVEFDRMALLPQNYDSDCKVLFHTSDYKLSEDEFLDHLAEASKRGVVIVALFDFKKQYLPLIKTTECVEDWEEQLKRRGINYVLRPPGLKTQRSGSCAYLLDQGAKASKVFDTVASTGRSPLFSLVQCGSSFLAVDIWRKKEPRAVLVRLLTVTPTGQIQETSVDYRPVEMHLRTSDDTPLKVAYMELDGNTGDPKENLSFAEVRSDKPLSWTTFATGAVCAVMDDNKEWWGTRVFAGSDGALEWPLFSLDPIDDQETSSIRFTLLRDGAGPVVLKAVR